MEQEKITQEQVDLADRAYRAEKSRKSTHSFLGLVGSLAFLATSMSGIIFFAEHMDENSMPQVLLLVTAIAASVGLSFLFGFLSARVGSTLRREDFGPTQIRLNLQRIVDDAARNEETYQAIQRIQHEVFLRQIIALRLRGII